MIRKFNISPTLVPYLKPEWHSEVIVSRINAFDEESATRIINEISMAHLSNQESVILIIDSFGGQVNSLAAILANLNSSSKKVITVIEGKAMSCGAYLAGFGTVGYRYACPDSAIMFHNMGWGATGNPTDIKATSKYFDKLQKHWCRKLAKHCGHKDEDYFLNLLKEHGNADIYLTPEQAKKHKLIDHISMPSINLKISLDITIE